MFYNKENTTNTNHNKTIVKLPQKVLQTGAEKSFRIGFQDYGPPIVVIEHLFIWLSAGFWRIWNFSDRTWIQFLLRFIFSFFLKSLSKRITVSHARAWRDQVMENQIWNARFVKYTLMFSSSSQNQNWILKEITLTFREKTLFWKTLCSTTNVISTVETFLFHQEK